MRKKAMAMLLVSSLAVAVSAGSVWAAGGKVEPGTIEVKVPLIDAKGEQVGKATLTQLEKGVKVQVEASGLTPGLHGIHFHENGKCDPTEFTSAGEHFNPEHKHHGLLNPEGPHAGDMPNLIVDSKGGASMSIFTRLITLRSGQPNSLLKDGGTSLIVHEKMDDEKTDPSGNSGARILCGVIKK
jgi:superoxide dismutase, Cu-Zn family